MKNVKMIMMMMTMKIVKEKAVLLAWLLVHWLDEPKLVPRFWSSALTIHSRLRENGEDAMIVWMTIVLLLNLAW